METVFGQALSLRLEKWDEHRPLESDTTGLKMSRGTFTFTFILVSVFQPDGFCPNFITFPFPSLVQAFLYTNLLAFCSLISCAPLPFPFTWTSWLGYEWLSPPN